ncbi:MAG TPA: glycosyltransferase family 4 protein [Streptosporangiaceae bacterium]|nr:glycosyltransferase family 4 protein [Streptosporangiaceae bacterium]
MHVVQLTDFYRPVIGGLERHVETLSHELVSLGHSVTVVTFQVGDQPAEETTGGVRVIRIRGWSTHLTAFHADAMRPFHPTIPDPGAMAALRRVIQRERPDVVHSHSWLAYSYFPQYRAQRGPGHVVALHDYGLACPKKTLQYSGRRAAADDAGQSCSGPRLAKCLGCAPEQYGLLKGAVVTAGLRASRVLHGRADRYIAVSDAVARNSRAVLPGGSRVAVIPTMVPNGLSELAGDTPRPEFLPAEDGYLMFAGAFGRHKGVDVLLEARRRMRNQPPLVLIGTSQGEAPRVNDPGVVVVRDIEAAQVMAAWMRASVAAVPSVWSEPLGRVAIEAMLVGRPVVASDVGGLRGIVTHGVTGLLVPPGDPAALAAALDSLLDDPQKRRQFGETARSHAQRFEAAVVVPQIVKVFEDAILGRADRQRDRR